MAVIFVSKDTLIKYVHIDMNQRIVILLLIALSVGFGLAQTPNLSVQHLEGTSIDFVLNHYLAGEGVTLSNGRFNNQLGNINSNQIGVFQRNGFTDFPFVSGLVMCTGDVVVAEGPNNSFSSSAYPTSSYEEESLYSLAMANLEDCASLDFDFMTNSDTFVFRYIFASEEYCEYVNSEYNDIFAFFLTGPDPVTLVQTTKNVAIIPGSISTSYPDGIPVAINNVNHGYHEVGFPGPGTEPSFPQYFIHNSSNTGTQFDGYTTALEAGATIQACVSYHMKISVCDVTDNLYDSGVFLEENSFESAPDPSLNMDSFYCLHDDIVFQYQAQGVDSVHIVTPSGDTLWSPPFIIANAQEADSGYYVLRAKKEASCSGDLWSRDSVYIDIHVPCVSELCDGAEFCAGTVMSYPYDYDSIVGPWVAYVSDNLFTIAPPTTLLADTTVFYALSMYDQYGCHFDTTVQAIIHVPHHIELDSVVCNSCTWNDTTYTQSGNYTIITQTAAGCDSLVTLHLTVHNTTTTTDTLYLVENQLPYYFAPADTTFAIGSPAQFQFTYTLPNHFQCDSVIQQTVLIYFNTLQVFDTMVCVNDLPLLWHEHLFVEAADFSDTLTTVNGSDSVLVLHLRVNPVYEQQLQASVCEGADYVVGGFLIPGNATMGIESLDSTLTLQTVNGCDSIVHLHLTIVDTTLHIVPLTEDFCENMSFELMVVTTFDNYVWSTGEESPNITVQLPGLYQVTASLDGCQVSAHYIVEGCDLQVYLPNAISPSKSDGLNDVFALPENLLPQMDDFEIRIFNRWGVQVFYSADKSFRWNGEVNGKLTVNTVYNYIIRYRGINGKPHIVNGTLTIL